MPYPQYIVDRPIRILINFILIVAFFIISPLVIFYTAGYRYDFAKKEIKKTGVISIDVTPQDTQAYLNNVLISNGFMDSPPLRKTNLAPGTYHLRLQKDGYKIWEKDVLVSSQQTTYIKNISLIQETKPTIVLSLKNINYTNTKPSINGNYYLVIAKNESFYEVYLVDTLQKNKILLEKTETTLEPIVSWSEFNDIGYILTKNTEENKTKIKIFSAENPTNNNDFTFDNKTLQQNSQWLPNNFGNSRLIIQEGEEINAIGIDGKENLGNVSSTVWYLETKNKIWSSGEEKNTIINLNSDGEEKYYFNNNVEKIIQIDKEKALVKTDKGIEVLIFQKNSETVEKKQISASNIILNKETKEFITWSDLEIWSIYQNGSLLLLNRQSEKTHQIIPFNRFGELLLCSDKTLTIFNPGYYVSTNLWSQTKVQNVSLNMTKRSVYFVSDINGEKGIFELKY